jgi:L-ascorbate metabolism protein UlaG (beta-lactamase superfamily)
MALSISKKSPPKQKSTALKTHMSIHHATFKPIYEYPVVEHATEHGFHNLTKKEVGYTHHYNFDLFDWLLTRQPAKWPKWEDAPEPTEKPVARPDAPLDDWKVWFIGHATVLIQIGPYNFLTDPVWSTHVSPAAGFGPKRVRAAGFELKDLPHIDAILLSHNHYDHLDLASLKWLYQRDRMPIYTGLVNRQYLPFYMQVIEMDWWQQNAFLLDDRVQIVFTPAQHFSGRGLKDRDKALWGGLSILTDKDHFFFAGDTGYSEHFSHIYQKLGAPRLALLPIGAYEPRHIMKEMHMNPYDAVQAHIDLNAKQSLAIHHRTFQLTDEAINQPLLDLADAMTQAKINAEQFFSLVEGYGAVV